MDNRSNKHLVNSTIQHEVDGSGPTHNVPLSSPPSVATKLSESRDPEDA